MSSRLSFLRSLSVSKRAKLSLVESDDVVGSHPARRSNRKTHLSPCGELARGFVVTARECSLRRSKIGIGQIAGVAVGHGELLISIAGFWLFDNGRAQKRNRFCRH